jgi:hypothetical protein
MLLTWRQISKFISGWMHSRNSIEYCRLITAKQRWTHGTHLRSRATPIRNIIIIIIIIMAQQPFVGSWPLFQFLDTIHSR